MVLGGAPDAHQAACVEGADQPASALIRDAKTVGELTRRDRPAFQFVVQGRQPGNGGGAEPDGLRELLDVVLPASIG